MLVACFVHNVIRRRLLVLVLALGPPVRYLLVEYLKTSL